jgi:hypothetical protein
MRIIKDHNVYGQEVTVFANSEAEAKQLAVKGRGHDWFAWEATEAYPAEGVLPGQWEVYIADHSNVFALND